VSAVHILEEDRELVSAQTGGRVGGPQTFMQSLGHRHQQLITGCVAQAVVDRLEVVEVEEQNGKRITSAILSRKCVLHPVREEGPVGEVGQGIVEGLVLELGL
jgi:hypothetical protein